ncbi:hypothetical protein Ancab_033933 [Ancistrocladus abbreviatus]
MPAMATRLQPRHHFKYPSPLLPFPIFIPTDPPPPPSLSLCQCSGKMDVFCLQYYSLKENSRSISSSMEKLKNGVRAKSVSSNSNKGERKPLNDITNLLYPQSHSTSVPFAPNPLASRRGFSCGRTRQNSRFHSDLDFAFENSKSTSLRMNFR